MIPVILAMVLCFIGGMSWEYWRIHHDRPDL
jgi:cbb3-type cytochrome oxidase subunit 3